jgi:GNAT superfamily N-acetyltransferase
MKIKQLVCMALATLFTLASVQQVVCMQIAPDVSFVFSPEKTSVQVCTGQLGLWCMLREKISDYTIRAIRPADHEAIQKIFKKNFGSFICEWEASQWLVLVVKGVVGGFIEYTPLSYCSGGLIDHLAVARKVRRHGYATRLLAVACKNLQERGFTSVTLWARVNNVPARCLYEQFEFVDENPNCSGRALVPYVLNLKNWSAPCKYKK